MGSAVAEESISTASTPGQVRAVVPSLFVRRAGTVFGIVLVAAFGWAAAPGEAQAPVRIGATAAQTGGAASNGLNLLRGYQLCVAHLNDNGGVLGRKRDLVAPADTPSAATAAQLYDKLITQDKVDLVLGPIAPSSTDAVANVAEKHKMPIVAGSVYRKGRKFTFSVSPLARVYFDGL